MIRAGRDLCASLGTEAIRTSGKNGAEKQHPPQGHPGEVVRSVFDFEGTVLVQRIGADAHAGHILGVTLEANKTRPRSKRSFPPQATSESLRLIVSEALRPKFSIASLDIAKRVSEPDGRKTPTRESNSPGVLAAVSCQIHTEPRSNLRPSKGSRRK